MAQQMIPNRIRFMFTLDLMDAARLRTYIKGKEVPAKAYGGRKLRKLTKPMSPSDFIESHICGILKDVTPDVESLTWMDKRFKANLKIREKNDALVKSGAFRTPESEWKKRGRVKGKVYPKYEEAMAKLAQRRAAAKSASAENAKKPKTKGKGKK